MLRVLATALSAPRFRINPPTLALPVTFKSPSFTVSAKAPVVVADARLVPVVTSDCSVAPPALSDVVITLITPTSRSISPTPCAPMLAPFNKRLPAVMTFANSSLVRSRMLPALLSKAICCALSVLDPTIFERSKPSAPAKVIVPSDVMVLPSTMIKLPLLASMLTFCALTLACINRFASCAVRTKFLPMVQSTEDVPSSTVGGSSPVCLVRISRYAFSGVLTKRTTPLPPFVALNASSVTACVLVPISLAISRMSVPPMIFAAPLAFVRPCTTPCVTKDKVLSRPAATSASVMSPPERIVTLPPARSADSAAITRPAAPKSSSRSPPVFKTPWNVPWFPTPIANLTPSGAVTSESAATAISIVPASSSALVAFSRLPTAHILMLIFPAPAFNVVVPLVTMLRFSVPKPSVIVPFSVDTKILPLSATS